MTTAFRRTAERRNTMVRWPISPREKSTKLAPFRIIAPLHEKLTAYLAKKLTFATPGPGVTPTASRIVNANPIIGRTAGSRSRTTRGAPGRRAGHEAPVCPDPGRPGPPAGASSHGRAPRCTTYEEPTLGRLQTLCTDGTRAVSPWSRTLQPWQTTITPPLGTTCRPWRKDLGP
jgi:hypothetical protein